MFVTNWISTTKIQKISEITNFFRHYFLSRTEVEHSSLSRIQPQKVSDQTVILTEHSMPDKFDENLSAWMQSKDICLITREKAETPSITD